LSDIFFISFSLLVTKAIALKLVHESTRMKYLTQRSIGCH